MSHHSCSWLPFSIMLDTLSFLLSVWIASPTLSWTSLPPPLVRRGQNCRSIMLCGVWQEDKLFWMYFSRLTSLHIKTSSTETLLSFMKYNISVSQMKISCPNEVKSKFNDAFIQTACSRKGRVGNGFFQNLYHLSTTPGLDTVLRAALPQLRSYTRTCKLGCCWPQKYIDTRSPSPSIMDP